VILNPWTISALFLAGIAIALAAVTVVMGMRSAVASRTGRAQVEANEDRGHLLVLLVFTLGLVRLLAWPQFFLLLKSYVPQLAPLGAMCAFGVTRVSPRLVAAVEWSKPLWLFAFAWWWLVELLRRRTNDASLARVRDVAAVAIAVLALGECALEVAYLLHANGGQAITCCTQLVDADDSRSSTNAMDALASSDARSFANYLAASVLAITAAFAAGHSKRQRGAWRSTPASFAIAVVGVGSLFATHAAGLGFVAPRVLGLPYHHCLYELVTDIPMLGLAALLACAGSACLALPLALAPFRRRVPTEVDRLQRSLLFSAVLTLASSTLVVLVHVA
jgi:hypothetical protein